MHVDLTIRADYLPAWRTFEGVRELIQNARDAEVEMGVPMVVRHDAAKSVLVVRNDGASIPHEALLIGYSTKSNDPRLIGRFGEGLKLGVLALVRDGREVVIRNGPEVWTPAIRRSPGFDADVLGFDIRRGRTDRGGLEVEVQGLGADDWAAMRRSFLFLLDREPGEGPAPERFVTPKGSVLTGPDMAEQLYVKGIRVGRNERLVMGYDLLDADLDRDRRMIEPHSLSARLREVWSHAALHDDAMFATFYELLSLGSGDVEGFQLSAPWRDADLAARVAKEFRRRHGERAFPVSTAEALQDLEFHLWKGVVVPEPMRKLAEVAMGTLSDLRGRLRHEVVQSVERTSLAPAERRALDGALALLARGCAVPAEHVRVAVFRDPHIQGLWAAPDILVARRVLADKDQTLLVLVHEAAHREGGDDGRKEHVDNVEEIWSRIVRALRRERVQAAA